MDFSPHWVATLAIPFSLWFGHGGQLIPRATRAKATEPQDTIHLSTTRENIVTHLLRWHDCFSPFELRLRDTNYTCFAQSSFALGCRLAAVAIQAENQTCLTKKSGLEFSTSLLTDPYLIVENLSP